MKMIIDIPEQICDFVQNTSFVEDESTLFKQTNSERQKTLVLFDIIDAIRNGTPLPEYHGRLIDEDFILRNTKSVQTVIDVNNAPTIIKESDTDEDR